MKTKFILIGVIIALFSVVCIESVYLQKLIETNIEIRNLALKYSVRKGNYKSHDEIDGEDWIIDKASEEFIVSAELLKAIRKHERGYRHNEYGILLIPDRIMLNYELDQWQYYACAIIIAQEQRDFAMKEHPKEFIKYLSERFSPTRKEWYPNVYKLYTKEVINK